MDNDNSDDDGNGNNINGKRSRVAYRLHCGGRRGRGLGCPPRQPLPVHLRDHNERQ